MASGPIRRRQFATRSTRDGLQKLQHLADSGFVFVLIFAHSADVPLAFPEEQCCLFLCASYRDPKFFIRTGNAERVRGEVAEQEGDSRVVDRFAFNACCSA